MKYSYKDLEEDLDVVLKAKEKDPLEKYSLELEGTMNTLSPMKVLDAIDGFQSFEERAQFVKELLEGCKVTVYKEDKKIVDVGVTKGMQWWAIEQFNQYPLALRCIVTSVYTMFLKKYVA